MSSHQTCQLSGCDLPVRAKQLCAVHYERQRLGRGMDAPINPDLRGVPFTARFEQNTQRVTSGCIEWRGVIDSRGYGKTNYAGKKQGAHRAAYLEFVGPIPDGYEVDHLCRNRCCVNPTHLEAVTKAENISRSYNPCAINARKTHCHRGHEFTERNTYYHGDGRRECKTCRVVRRSDPHGIPRPGAS